MNVFRMWQLSEGIRLKKQNLEDMAEESTNQHARDKRLEHLKLQQDKAKLV